MLNLASASHIKNSEEKTSISNNKNSKEKTLLNRQLSEEDSKYLLERLKKCNLMNSKQFYKKNQNCHSRSILDELSIQFKLSYSTIVFITW